MKRLMTLVAALVVLLGGGPDLSVSKAEARTQCCWLYCEAYRDVCKLTFDEDAGHCNAFYDGCIDGCRYPGPTS